MDYGKISRRDKSASDTYLDGVERYDGMPVKGLENQSNTLFLKGEILGVKPNQGRSLIEGIDASSKAKRPYNALSPFSFSPHFEISVPGREGVYSNSVESIWQGLKIIDGMVDFSLFKKKPKKKKRKCSRPPIWRQSIGFIRG